MRELDFLSDEIFKRYGTIQRARGCFLYTKKGVRLTDMYQEGGRAILGWGGSSSFTVFKNVLNRGITGTFFTEYDSRIQNAVSKLLASERRVFFYNSKENALKESLAFFSGETRFFRPWENSSIDWSSLPSVILEPPLPWTKDIFILAVKAESPKDFQKIDSGIKINAPMQAAISRSIYNLIKEIQVRKESDWFLYDTVLNAYFERKGPYLYPKIPKEMYDAAIVHFLDSGIVISPDFSNPSIVPFGADLGVFSKLKKNPFKY